MDQDAPNLDCHSQEAVKPLNPPTARSSPNCGTPWPHTLPSTKPPPFPALHPHFANALDEALAHLLIARALDRRQVARHLAILILLDLEHVRAASLHSVEQLAHGNGIRRNARLHLIRERPAAFELLLHHVAPAVAEALLRGAQLGGL